MSQSKPNSSISRKHRKKGSTVIALRGNSSVPVPGQNSIDVVKKLQTNKEKSRSLIPTKIFTLDTNVLAALINAILYFAEHDVFITWQALMELDKLKVGTRKVNMLARRAIDLLLRMKVAAHTLSADKGIPLVEPGMKPPKGIKPGKLFFSVPSEKDFLSGNFRNADHPDLIIIKEHILNRNAELARIEKLKTKSNAKTAYRTKNDFPFVSKDKMARLFALLLGSPAQDFKRDLVDLNKVLDDRVHYFPNNFWDNCKEEIPSQDAIGNSQKNIRVFSARPFRDIHINEFVVIRGNSSAPERQFRVVDKISPEIAHLREVVDYRKKANALMGVTALNSEQNRALDVCLDPSVRVVLLYGDVGTSKTFMATLAGYYQMMMFNRYRQFVVTRVPLSRGQSKLEAVPGAVAEKMAPYIKGVSSNTWILANYFTRHMFPEATKSKISPIEQIKQQLSKKKKDKDGGKGNGGAGGGENSFDACRSKVFEWMVGARKIEHPATIVGYTFFDEIVLYEEVQDNITDDFREFLTRLGTGNIQEGTQPKFILTGSVQQMRLHLDDGDSAFAKLIGLFTDKKGLAKVMLTECQRDPLVEYFNKEL